VQKAVVLLYLDKAELVSAHDGRRIHAVHTSVPFPSVIRLQRYCRVPHKDIILSRKNILRRDGYCCQYCGTTAGQLTVDHIIPKSQGGKDSWENLVTACLRCNGRKGHRPPEDAGLRLRTPPRRPSHVSFLTHSIGLIYENWKPYLFIV
jgi:5-methylcytosine-specific restriction endonuclease McrA